MRQIRELRYCLVALCIGLALAWVGPATAATCTSGACVSMGPRLASVSNTTQSTLLNAVMGGLMGNSSLNISIANWNSLAQGDINLDLLLKAVQAQTGAVNTSTALTTGITLAQLVAAATTVAQADGNTALVTALNALSIPVAGVSGTIPLSGLLTASFPPGALTNVRLNALNLIGGMIQVFNYQNAVVTPTPITISGANLGQAGTIANVIMQLQVIQPPVYVCGPANTTTMYSAAIRMKLQVDLVDINIPLGLGPATLGNLDIYVDIARANGIATTINAVSNAVTVQATPGIANLYIGNISNTNFFTNHTIVWPTDVGYGNVGSVSILGIGAGNLQMRSYTNIASAGSPSSFTFTGPYPQTRTFSSSTTSTTTLLNSLVANLQVTSDNVVVNLVSGLLALLLGQLQGLLDGTTEPLNIILVNVIDPLLTMLGIHLGQVDVTVSAVALACTISGVVYHDLNHNGQRDAGETGTGQTLYTKPFVGAAAATQFIAVTPGTGAYTLPNVGIGTYSLIVDNSNLLTDITPTLPSGWIPTQPSNSQRSFTVSNNGVDNMDFGLYNGSQLTGTIFADTGTGGTANNGIKEGSESGIGTATVKVTNNAGSTTYDTTTSAADGSYQLWIPSGAGATVLKVTETNVAGYVSTGGSVGSTVGTYDRTTDTTTFTNAVGTIYTGVNFGDVPPNTLDTDGLRTVLPGVSVFYPHTFVAGTAGDLTLSVSANTASPATPVWTNAIYRDNNCNGTVEATDSLVTTFISVTAGQKLCLILKVFVPANAPYGAENKQTLSASFSYTGATPALNASAIRNDTTIVGNASDAGLKLVKSVDKATATPGQTLLYTITYSNDSKGNLTNLKINDMTPAYTVFASAACGALPTGLSACVVSTQPAVAASGNLVWNFTGTLRPGANGTVTYTVTVQ